MGGGVGELGKGGGGRGEGGRDGQFMFCCYYLRCFFIGLCREGVSQRVGDFIERFRATDCHLPSVTACFVIVDDVVLLSSLP